MTRAVVIGGTGHSGTCLVPRLVGDGHEVVVLTRGDSNPYQAHAAWRDVQRVQVDRVVENAEGTFGGSRGRLSRHGDHPGHISGPGWTPINPAESLDLEVFQQMIDRGSVALPDGGMTTLQHVHADDVAGVFAAAMSAPSVSIGQSFRCRRSSAHSARVRRTGGGMVRPPA